MAVIIQPIDGASAGLVSRNARRCAGAGLSVEVRSPPPSQPKIVCPPTAGAAASFRAFWHQPTRMVAGPPSAIFENLRTTRCFHELPRGFGVLADGVFFFFIALRQLWDGL